jgi:hypothetical protein
MIHTVMVLSRMEETSFAHDDQETKGWCSSEGQGCWKPHHRVGKLIFYISMNHKIRYILRDHLAIPEHMFRVQ